MPCNYTATNNPQVEYIRNYPRQKSFLSDPLLMKGWPDVFYTCDKHVVEKELKESQMEYEWNVGEQACEPNSGARVNSF